MSPENSSGLFVRISHFLNEFVWTDSRIPRFFSVSGIGFTVRYVRFSSPKSKHFFVSANTAEKQTPRSFLVNIQSDRRLLTMEGVVYAIRSISSQCMTPQMNIRIFETDRQTILQSHNSRQLQLQIF